MNHKGTITLKTDRLVLRQICETDAQEMFDNYGTDERVTAYLPWSPHKNVNEVEALIKSWIDSYKNLDYYQWAIVFDGKMIGTIGCILVDTENKYCELGWCIAYDFWGKGIVAEALNAMLGFLFDEVGMEKIMAKHDAENPNSGKVMVKCKMKFDKIIKNHYQRNDDTFGDSVVYTITKNDWNEKYEL